MADEATKKQQAAKATDTEIEEAPSAPVKKVRKAKPTPESANAEVGAGESAPVPKKKKKVRKAKQVPDSEAESAPEPQDDAAVQKAPAAPAPKKKVRKVKPSPEPESATEPGGAADSVEEAPILESEVEDETPAAPKKLKKKVRDEAVVEPVEKAIKPRAEHVPKVKPELDDAEKAALLLRASHSARRPAFKRQEWFRYKRLGTAWRKPRGIQSSMRLQRRYRPPIVKVGYRGPQEARGLHPSGFRDVLVHNQADLEILDPKRDAARIASGVGSRKRAIIEAAAVERGIRILNPGGGR